MLPKSRLPKELLRDMASVLFLGRRRIKTATSNLGDLAETDRTCARGAPYCLPFVSLICVPSRGAVVGIEWGNRCDAAGDIEDLAGELYCVRADRDFVCRDSSDRGIAPERRNAECERSWLWAIPWGHAPNLMKPLRAR